MNSKVSRERQVSKQEKQGVIVKKAKTRGSERRQTWPGIWDGAGTKLGKAAVKGAGEQWSLREGDINQGWERPKRKNQEEKRLRFGGQKSQGILAPSSLKAEQD